MNDSLEPDPISLVLIALYKGVVTAERDPSLWQHLLELQARVRDHVRLLGLELRLDETEGYAWLQTRTPREGEPELPRLVTRRQLSFPVSLLLALLRKKQLEWDATGGDTRLILHRDEILDLMRLFLAAGTDESRLVRQIDTHINKVIELGFLRRLRGQENRYEVHRLLKAFVDAQWLSDFQARLEEYRAHLQVEVEKE